MPPTYMAIAILSTIFCCLPFGIVSIVKASQVGSLYGQGSYEEAQKASKSAKKWAIISAVTAVGLGLLYFIFSLVLAAIGASCY